jgi:hypothetical protein
MLINYWWQIEPENNQFTLIIKANSDTINVVEGFKNEDDALLYAETYIRGYKDARGEL